MTWPTESDLPPHPRDEELRPQSDWEKQLTEGREVTVRQWRETNRCGVCGVEHWDPDKGYINQHNVDCSHGCCTSIRCTECDHSSASFGPVMCGCPCDEE